MATSSGTGETVFTVLASAARERSTPSLWLQLGACALLAVVIVIVAPQWWSVSALLVGPAAYAAWGLAFRRERTVPYGRVSRVAPVVLSVIGSAAAVVGSLGLAMALFTGHAGGIKNACGPKATDARCEAWANPPARSRPVLP